MKRALVLLAIAIVATATYVAAGFVGARAGLYHALRAATPDAFLVVTSDMVEELNGLPGELAKVIRDGLPADLRAFAVDERIVRAEYVAPNSTDVKDVLVRGTEARALALHGVTLTGRFPNEGERAVVIPRGRAAMVRDGRVHFAATWWTVVGTLNAPGTIYESEVWCDRGALLAALHDEPAGVLFFHPPHASDAAAMSAVLAQHKEDLGDFVVASERDVREAALQRALHYRPLWMLVTALVFLIAAAAAATVSIARTIDATPRARSMIAFAGGAIGGVLACLVRATHDEDTLAFLYPTPRSPAVLLAIFGVIAIVAVVAALSASRSPSTAGAR